MGSFLSGGKKFVLHLEDSKQILTLSIDAVETLAFFVL